MRFLPHTDHLQFSTYKFINSQIYFSDNEKNGKGWKKPDF